jgi:periplasmic protein TonB
MTAAAGQQTANDRMKQRAGDWFWYSVAGAAGLHLMLFALFPSLTAADYTGRTDELVAIDIPDQIEIPPPPEQIARPATPVVSDLVMDDDITIPPTTFEANPPDLITAPPAASGAADELAATPRFMRMEVRPELLNQRDLERLLQRHYPPLLRDAGVGGRPIIWFFIDTDGRVLDARLHTSSGYVQLDEAALQIAPQMRFSPAMNRNQRIQVWVEIPIVFSAR